MTLHHWQLARESQGNGSLLILVDTTRPEYLHVPSIVFSALAHFGMPYRLLDVAHFPLQTHDLLGHRAVLIAQEHIGDSLGGVPLDVENAEAHLPVRG